MIKGKKGEKLMSLFWIFMLIIVGGGVSVSTITVYGAEIDVRNIEAEILNDRILDCIVEDGFLVEGFDENFDVFGGCKINSEAIEDNFYFRIIFTGEKTFEIVRGTSFETECGLTEYNVIEVKYFPKCVKRVRNVVYVDGGIKEGSLEVLTASNQVGGRNVID